MKVDRKIFTTHETRVRPYLEEYAIPPDVANDTEDQDILSIDISEETANSSEPNDKVLRTPYKP